MRIGRIVGLCTRAFTAHGVHNFRGVTRHGESFYAVLFFDNSEDSLQLLQCFSEASHHGVTSLDRGNLGNPGIVLLAIQNDFVIFKLHESQTSAALSPLSISQALRSTPESIQKYRPQFHSPPLQKSARSDLY